MSHSTNAWSRGRNVGYRFGILSTGANKSNSVATNGNIEEKPEVITKEAVQTAEVISKEAVKALNEIKKEVPLAVTVCEALNPGWGDFKVDLNYKKSSAVVDSATPVLAELRPWEKRDIYEVTSISSKLQALSKEEKKGVDIVKLPDVKKSSEDSNRMLLQKADQVGGVKSRWSNIIEKPEILEKKAPITLCQALNPGWGDFEVDLNYNKSYVVTDSAAHSSVELRPWDNKDIYEVTSISSKLKALFKERKEGVVVKLPDVKHEAENPDQVLFQRAEQVDGVKSGSVETAGNISEKLDVLRENAPSTLCPAPNYSGGGMTTIKCQVIKKAEIEMISAAVDQIAKSVGSLSLVLKALSERV